MTIRAYQDLPDRQTVSGVESFREGLLQLASVVYAEEAVDSVLQSCAEIVYGSLQADYVELLEHLPELPRFDRRANYPVPDHVQPDPTAGQAIPQDLGSQAGYTLLRNQPVVVTDTEKEDRFDPWEPLETVSLKSGLTVPITYESFRLGVLGVYCLKSRDYADEEVAFLTEGSRYLANGIVRRRETQIRRATEKQLRMVEEATSRAASALDEQLALQSLARLFSSSENGLAEVCLIDMDGPDDRLHRAAAGIDGVLLEDSDTARTPLLYPQEPDCPHGPSAVLSSGQPDIITEVTDEHLSILARDEAHLDRLRDRAPVSYVCVPLKVRRHALGGLVLMSRKRLYTDREARHAARLGSIVALAVDGIRARLATLDDGRGYVYPYLRASDTIIQPWPLAQTKELVRSKDVNPNKPSRYRRTRPFDVRPRLHRRRHSHRPGDHQVCGVQARGAPQGTSRRGKPQGSCGPWPQTRLRYGNVGRHLLPRAGAPRYTRRPSRLHSRPVHISRAPPHPTIRRY